MTALLVADCIAKSFAGRRVLSSASLRAEAGQFRALLGRNGAGKSTLLKIACGWMAPDAGAVHFDGQVYLSPTHAQLGRLGVFYWPDEDLLSNAFSIRHQLEMLRRQFDGSPVADAAEEVGIGPFLDHRPFRLSGGERRRAELAAVLVRRPRCLLADEPYRGVAPLDAEVLTTHFKRLAVQQVAVVVTGHEVPTLLEATDHVTWCTSGTTYELGPPSLAARNERFRREYLGASHPLPSELPT